MYYRFFWQNFKVQTLMRYRTNFAVWEMFFHDLTNYLVFRFPCTWISQRIDYSWQTSTQMYKTSSVFRGISMYTYHYQSLPQRLVTTILLFSGEPTDCLCYTCSCGIAVAYTWYSPTWLLFTHARNLPWHTPLVGHTSQSSRLSSEHQSHQQVRSGRVAMVTEAGGHRTATWRTLPHPSYLHNVSLCDFFRAPQSGCTLEERNGLRARREGLHGEYIAQLYPIMLPVQACNVNFSTVVSWVSAHGC